MARAFLLSMTMLLASPSWSAPALGGAYPGFGNGAVDDFMRTLGGQNPAETMGAYELPPGTHWLNESCRHIPCALDPVKDFKDEAELARAMAAQEEATPGKVVRIGLRYAVDMGGGQVSLGGACGATPCSGAPRAANTVAGLPEKLKAQADRQAYADANDKMFPSAGKNKKDSAPALPPMSEFRAFNEKAAKNPPERPSAPPEPAGSAREDGAEVAGLQFPEDVSAASRGAADGGAMETAPSQSVIKVDGTQIAISDKITYLKLLPVRDDIDAAKRRFESGGSGFAPSAKSDDTVENDKSSFRGTQVGSNSSGR